jgi:hypothetical protein
MSSVWSEILLNLEKDGTTVQLEHAILKPNFFIPAEIMHQSTITEKRTWSKDIHFSEFTVLDLLFLYANPITKAEELIDLENNKYLFTPFNMLWSKYVLITLVEFRPLEGSDISENKDIAYISMAAADPGTLGAYFMDKAGNRFKDKAGNYIRRRIRGL